MDSKPETLIQVFSDEKLDMISETLSPSQMFNIVIISAH